MAPERRRPTRRAYLASVGGLAALAGCGNSSPTGTETIPEGTPDPEHPLAERYDVARRGAVYRETTDGPLRAHGAIPDGEGPFPVLVHVHGGGWRVGGPGFEGMDAFAAAGVAVVSLEYRLSGTATYPEPVRDVAAGVQWTRANEPGWNIDRGRIALVGDSAGAHLAGLVAAAPELPTFQPRGFAVDEEAYVDAFIGHYGIYDLRQMPACENRNTSQFFGEDCADEDVLAEASPVTHLHARHPPVLLFHGTADQLVPVESSRAYRDALEASDVPVEYGELEGVGHGYVEPSGEDQAAVGRETHRRTVTYLFGGPWSGA